MKHRSTEKKSGAVPAAGSLVQILSASELREHYTRDHAQLARWEGLEELARVAAPAAPKQYADWRLAGGCAWCAQRMAG